MYSTPRTLHSSWGSETVRVKIVQTCEYLFPQVGEQLHVDDGSDNSLQGAKLGVYPEGEEHQEEEDGPELCPGELVDGLREDDERQARARRWLHIITAEFYLQ